MNAFTPTTAAGHVARPQERPRGLLDPFSLFAEDWKRVGMPGEPRSEPDGTVSVAVESWGVRVFYRPRSAVIVLQRFPAAERVSDEDEAAIAEALGEFFSGAVERSEPIEGAESWEASAPASDASGVVS